jgi:hypothetical protein
VLLSLAYPRFKDFMFEFPEVMYHLLGRLVERLTVNERQGS